MVNDINRPRKLKSVKMWQKYIIKRKKKKKKKKKNEKKKKKKKKKKKEKTKCLTSQQSNVSERFKE